MYIERSAKLKLTMEEFRRLEDVKDILITIYNKLNSGECVINIDRSDTYNEYGEYTFLVEFLALGDGDRDNNGGVVTFEVSEV